MFMLDTQILDIVFSGSSKYYPVPSIGVEILSVINVCKNICNNFCLNVNKLTFKQKILMIIKKIQWCLALRLPRITTNLLYDDLFAIAIAK